MNFFSAMNLLLNHGKRIYRECDPAITYEFDGSENARYNIWMHNSITDESIDNWKFGFDAIVATDWEFK